MTHTQDINPSEDAREKIIVYLELALKDAEKRIMELEGILRKNKQKLEDDAIKEYEIEEAHYKGKVKLLEDAKSKTERTSGHTLKKAYNKKCMEALHATLPEAKYTELEALLAENGIHLHHDKHHYGKHHHEDKEAVAAA